MIISRGRSYIFVHIPKTGGTAMAMALEGRAQKDDILIGDTPKALRRKRRLKTLQPVGRLWKHSTLTDVEGIVSRTDMAEMFVFTLVRNPWNRMVSYYHWLQMQRFDHPAVALAQSCSFCAFVQHRETVAMFRAFPFDHYMRDGAGAEHCNLYARLEHLNEDLVPLWAHLGFDCDIPHANQSRRKTDWRGYYSDAAAQAVGEMAATDIARFHYSFDPPG